MDIIFYWPEGNPAAWLAAFQAAFPQARLRVWQEGDHAPADYAVVWRPVGAMLRGRTDLKAIFNLGAGVDGVLQLGDDLPAGVPIVRLDDAGMAAQMADYVTHAALHFFRRFDAHAENAADGQWRFVKPFEKNEFTIGVMGLGILGTRVVQALAPFGFPLRGWSRSPKSIPGVQTYAGEAGLDAFLRGTRMLVCLLPLTPETESIMNRSNLEKLQPGGYVINVARGAHLVEEDLLSLVQSRHIAGATLDVFREEPLPLAHPFWSEPRINITPHVAALTLRDETVRQITAKIGALERGEPVAGVVDRTRGY
jgi:glyoxylate/hydroxypyruvate reductase A